MPREYKYHATFSAKARCLLDSERGENLAKASLADLKTVLPKDFEQFPDLLPIAGNAAVVNMANDNTDLMDNSVAKTLYPKFTHKFINDNHDRSKIIGHLTTSALTKFDANYANGSGSETLDPETIEGFDPYNISVGGYIYAAVAPDIVENILAANDPSDPSYLSISFSWEVGFDEFHILKGSRDRNDAKASVITDPDEIKRLSKKLITKGGNGKDDDGEKIYRLIVYANKENGEIDYDSVIPMGIAVTATPAGQVKGLITPDFAEASTKKDESKAQNDQIPGNTHENQENNKKSENKISQIESISVNTNTTSVKSITKMKALTSLKDLRSLNDETVKEYSFANIQVLLDSGIQQEIQAKMETVIAAHETKLEAEKQAAVAAKADADKAKLDLETLKANAAKLEKDFNDLKATQEQEAKAAKFSLRMSSLDTDYDLTPEARKALASRIKDFSDEEFKSYVDNEFAVLASALKKKAPEQESEKEKAEKAKAAAETALASAKPDGSVISQPSVSETLMEKYKESFGGVTITKEDRK